ncbi:hypothetical protein Ciccas_011487, partial [Cichlidogyrus casuarinus]
LKYESDRSNEITSTQFSVNVKPWDAAHIYHRLKFHFQITRANVDYLNFTIDFSEKLVDLLSPGNSCKLSLNCISPVRLSRVEFDGPKRKESVAVDWVYFPAYQKSSSYEKECDYGRLTQLSNLPLSSRSAWITPSVQLSEAFRDLGTVQAISIEKDERCGSNSGREHLGEMATYTREFFAGTVLRVEIKEAFRKHLKLLIHGKPTSPRTHSLFA